jgi:FAD/FMN-containing dehydrogenase
VTKTIAGSFSWGRLPLVEQQVIEMSWRDQGLPDTPCSLLPWGLGRSYGDSCVNDGNAVLSTRRMNRLIGFDSESGRLHCEAGVSLADILTFAAPQGWFLPVTPGTKFVTVGGAIANDVHGKNHESAGNFGHHVQWLELLRSEEGLTCCSPDENRKLFHATIGGLGLTGLILSAEIQLKPISNQFIASETVRFDSLDEFRALSEDSAAKYEYTVAWFDCMAATRKLGRGLFTRGNHADNCFDNLNKHPPRRLVVPFDLPGFVLNPITIKAFNGLYFRKQGSRRGMKIYHYERFFYPLDAIQAWNRIYGKRGFYQYQCVVPADDYAVTRELLSVISASEAGSFLAVLKEFGDIPSLGMLSFPKPGITIALDFPNKYAATRTLLDRLDAVVMAADGSVYPAKDTRLSGTAFKAYYPRWKEFSAFIDPKFSSSFWRRVSAEVSER